MVSDVLEQNADEHYITLTNFQFVAQTSRKSIDPVEFKEALRRAMMVQIFRQSDAPYKNRYLEAHNDLTKLPRFYKFNPNIVGSVKAQFFADPNAFSVTFNQSTGSIVIKDGEIKIKSAWLLVLFTLVYGSLDFVKDYENYKKGFQALMADIIPVVSSVGSYLPDFHISHFESKQPNPENYFYRLVTLARREDTIPVRTNALLADAGLNDTLFAYVSPMTPP